MTMVDIDEILPFLIALVALIIISYGIITTIKKSFKPLPRQNVIDSRMKLKEQQWHMDDVRRRQKQLLRDQKQKIRDLQRR